MAQRVDHPQPDVARRLVQLDLEGGADALALVAATSPWSRGFGLEAPHHLSACLEGVDLRETGLRLDAGAATPAWAEALATLRHSADPDLAVDLGFDPIALASRGRSSRPGEMVALVTRSQATGLAGRPIMADGRPWHEAGATPAQELGLVLATAVAHWRTLVAEGLSLEKAQVAVAVLLAFDAELCEGLAKARAMRRLWARLEAACELEPKAPPLHAETSWRMMTRRDVATNAMRATAAVFAAGLGGADTITVLPQTLACGLPDMAARRLARNTSLVMLEEAHLGAVDDAAAGSGTLEASTETLCLEAWTVFQSIERTGGIAAGLADGTVARALAISAAARRRDVEQFDRGLVGTTRFACLDDLAPTVLGAPRRSAAVDQRALPCLRDAEPIERLRDEAERLAANGFRPRVALAPLGGPAASGPRAAAAVNVLAAAGIATIDLADGNAEAGVAAAAGLPVCLVGDDAAYAASGEAAVVAFRAAGATRLYALDGAVTGAACLPTSGEGVLPSLRDIVGLRGPFSPLS